MSALQFNPATTTASVADESRLLAEFPPVTTAEWKALVEVELKGAPFEKKMRSSTWEGITLEPLYGPADGGRVPHAGSLPGFAPFVRGARAAGYLGQPWEVSQEITASSPAAFNDAARAYLQHGLTALNIVVDRATRNGADPDWASPEEVGAGGLSIATLTDLDRALDGIDLEAVPLFVRTGASGMPFAALLAALARRRGSALARLRGCVEVDPLGVLAHEGRLPQSLEAAYREMAALTAWAAGEAPALQTLCVHSRAWHEAGGSAVHELGFALATAAEYFRALHAQGLETEQVAPRVRLAFTVGSRFFVEIAKLRAARMLWARLVAVLGGSEAAQRPSLHVRTSRFNKTVYDPHTNLLRTTVEAFGAVLGGCDSLQVGAFDEVGRAPDDFSERLARNQQLILREECHLTQVIDPAGGSWFVETLTDELARRGWGLFQEVEKMGGMAAALAAEFPQRQVADLGAQRLRNVALRRESVVGINCYADPGGKPLETAPVVDPAVFHRRRVQQVAAARTTSDESRHEIVLDRLAGVLGQQGAELVRACVAAAEAGATLGEITRAVRIMDRPDTTVTPVCLTRVAAEFERLRSAVDARAATGQRLRVFLANLGPLKQHRARAEFSRGFLEVAGFAVVASAGFPTPEEAARAAIESGADAVCVCSTDETYAALVPPLAAAWRAGRPGAPLILAGHPPEQVDALRAAGVDFFIHVRANALETLTAMAARLGVSV